MARWRLGIFILAGMLCAFAGYGALRASGSAHADQQPPSPPGVPVTVQAARVQDVPVFLDGLGTVQAYNVVEIKAQVSGPLIALTARQGQEVHKGDIVAEIDPRPFKAALDRAIAQKAEDVAQLQAAQLDLQRFQDLAKQHFAPVQQVDDQRATVEKETAAIAADQAMIETGQIDLGYCIIRAPIDGRVSLSQLDVGNLVQTSSQSGIISITQDKPISVVFTLPEADLPRIQDALAKRTLPVEVFAGGGSQDGRPLADGTLLTPNNTIDTNSGTILLKATFDNTDDHLWPGQFVNTRLQVDTLRKAITVPVVAVQHGPGGLFVYVVNADRTVTQTPVQEGYQDAGRAVITKVLPGGETVVVTGQSRLSPGTRVEAKASTPAPVDAASAD